MVPTFNIILKTQKVFRYFSYFNQLANQSRPLLVCYNERISQNSKPFDSDE